MKSISWSKITTVIFPISVFTILSVLFTWPLVLHLDTHLWGNSDTNLATFIIDSGIQKMLSFDIIGYFEAPFFAWLPQSLSYSEHFFAQSILGLPIQLIFHNPIITYNVVFILTFILSGVGTYFLSLELKQKHFAAILAGFIVSFCSFRLSDPRIAVLSFQYIPFILLFIARFLRKKDRTSILLFIIFSVLQILSSWYYAIILLIGLLVILAVLLYFDRAAVITSTASHRITILILVIVTTPLLWFFIQPYLSLQSQNDVGTHSDQLFKNSASLPALLTSSTSNVLYGSHAETFTQAQDKNIVKEKAGLLATPQKKIPNLFLGFTIFLAAGLGLGAISQVKQEYKKIYLAIFAAGITSFLLALGPYDYLGTLKIPLPYSLLEAIPLLDFVRETTRFIVWFIIGIALLAGLGISKLFTNHLRGSTAVGIIVSCLILLEYFSFPLNVTERTNFKAEVYQHIATLPHESVILEFPTGISNGRTIAYESNYVLAAAFHGKSIVNGYSGYVPSEYQNEMSKIALHFPSKNSLKQISEVLGATHIVIHHDELSVSETTRIANLDQLTTYYTPVWESDNTSLLELEPFPTPKVKKKKS